MNNIYRCIIKHTKEIDDYKNNLSGNSIALSNHPLNKHFYILFHLIHNEYELKNKDVEKEFVRWYRRILAKEPQLLDMENKGLKSEASTGHFSIHAALDGYCSSWDWVIFSCAIIIARSS